MSDKLDDICQLLHQYHLYFNIDFSVVAVYDDDIHFMWISVSLIMANCHTECKSLHC